jgi:acetylornithine deacetylase/succinyl-diaminopimelate desuccinylase-like protein
MAATELLKELLSTDTTNPPGNEEAAAQILEDRLRAAGLQTRIEASPSGRANLVARLEGPTDKPALVLLSHTDVVAVEPDHWSHDPFGGEIDKGAVWGRGALDMKGIAAMHVEAAIELAASGGTPRRELIVCSVADEEAGGGEGAGWLTSERPALVGFADSRPPPEVLGEGGYGLRGIIDRPLMPIVMGEKYALWLRLTAQGEPGHGSLPPTRQAPANLAAVVQQVCGYRSPRVHPVMREQFHLLADATSGARAVLFRTLASGAGTAIASVLRAPLRTQGAIAALLSDTVTLTALHAGYKHNVVPGEAVASLDCRLLPDTDPDEFTTSIRKTTARSDVSVDVVGSHGGPVSAKSDLYRLLAEVSSRLESRPVVAPSLTPGFTDVRYFRRLGATGYGFVPFMLDSELLSTVHGHDERVPLAELETGTKAMAEVVRRACS